MDGFQRRVVDEKKELDARLGKLKSFLVGRRSAWAMGGVPAGVSKEELDRLAKQAEIMDQYSLVLGERIANFR